MNDFKNNFSKEEVTLKELFFLIKSQIIKLLSIIVIFLFFALFFLIITRPLYTSSSSIIVEEENSTMSSIFDMGLGSDKNYLENEIEVLKSRSTAEKTIQSLLDSEHRNNLHIFNTKDFQDGLLRKFFRSLSREKLSLPSP